MFAWWGRTVFRYRYIVIGVMVALCLGGGVYGISLGQHVTQSGFYDEGSESVHASVVSDKAYGRDTSGHIIGIYTAPEGKTVDDPAFRRRSWTTWPRSRRTTPTRSCARSATSRAQKCSRNMADADKQHAFMSIQLKGDNDDAILTNYNKNVGEDGTTVKEALNIPGVDVQQAGLQPLASELTGTIGEDQQRVSYSACRWSWSCCSSCSAASSRPPADDRRRPDHRRVAWHHASAGRVHPRALLRPTGGDADRARHRDRLRAVHRQPVPGGDRRGLRHRSRPPSNGDDLGPHDHVLRGDHRGVGASAAAVPAGLPQVHHLRDHRHGHAVGDPVDHRARRCAGHPRPQYRRARRAHAAAGAVPAELAVLPTDHRLVRREDAEDQDARRGRAGLLGQARQPGDEAAHRVRRADHHRDDPADHPAGPAVARRHQREVPAAGQQRAPGAGAVRQDLPRVPHRAADHRDGKRRRSTGHRCADRRGAQQGDADPGLHRPQQRPVEDVAGTALSRRSLQGPVGPRDPERSGEPQRRRREDRGTARDTAAARHQHVRRRHARAGAGQYSQPVRQAADDGRRPHRHHHAS